MFMQDIYDRAPVPIQNLLVSAYGLVLHRRRYGGACRRYAEELSRTERLPAGELASLVDERIREVVSRAAQRSAFYRERFRETGVDSGTIRGIGDLAKLPFLEKEDLRRHARRILTHWPDGESLYRSSTSGTTGTPITLYTNRTTERRNYSFFLRLQRWMGVEMGEPRATFYGRTLVPVDSHRPPFWRHDLSENSWQFSSYHLGPGQMGAYLEQLAKIRPTEIRGYPSSLVQIARGLSGRRNLEIHPRAVQTTAETLLPHWRREIEDAFACRVFDQYGSSEMSHYVSQCEKGTYHVHPEYGVVEVLVDGRPAHPGEEGEVVCTSFVNVAMPLIRYRIGDLAVPGSGPCACGRAFPVLERISGRVDDVLILPDGRSIGRLDPVFKGAKGIREAQLVQTAPDRVTLNLVTLPGFDRAAQESVLEELRRRFGLNVSIKVVLLSEIPKGRNGKFRAVVREFPLG